jgi:hypothetical protein
MRLIGERVAPAVVDILTELLGVEAVVYPLSDASTSPFGEYGVADFGEPIYEGKLLVKELLRRHYGSREGSLLDWDPRQREEPLEVWSTQSFPQGSKVVFVVDDGVYHYTYQIQKVDQDDTHRRRVWIYTLVPMYRRQEDDQD